MVLTWLLTGERRWLSMAWVTLRYAAFGLLVVLILFAGEALWHV